MSLEQDLALHHSATLRAIEIGRVDLAKRRLKAYVLFAKAFLDAASKKGVTFSSETAMSVSFLDWPTATQIIDNAADCIIAGIKSNNAELLANATYLPIEFLRMSVQRRDFLFYRRMLRLYPSILSISYDPISSNTKQLIMDRSWRYLRKFTDYSLVTLTESQETDLQQQFIQPVLWTFSDLMKVALDHGDLSTFDLLGRELNKLLERTLFQNEDHSETTSLPHFIRAERGLIWFGFGAWLARSYVLSEAAKEPGLPDPKIVQPSIANSFVKIVVDNFPDIRTLCTTYLAAQTRQFRNFHWEDWLLDTLPEETSFSINFREELTQFYTIAGLLLSKSGTPNASDIPSPHRELQYYMEDIRKFVEQIRQNPTKLTTLIPMLDDSKALEGGKFPDIANYFLTANEAAIEEWRAKRNEEIISAPLEPSRLDLFKEECYKGWLSESWVSKLFTDLGRHEMRAATPDATYLAVHYLMDKEAFIASRDAEYVGFGRDAGAQVGRALNRELLKMLDVRSISPSQETIETIVDRVAGLLSGTYSGSSLPIVFIFGSFELERRFEADGRVTLKWREATRRFDTSTYLGRMGEAPIFFIRDKSEQKVIVLEVTGVGNLIQYVPPEDNYKGLLVRLKAVNEQVANNILKDQPQRLRAKDGSSRDKEIVLKELLGQVEVFVGAKFELIVEHPEKVKVIVIVP